MYYDFGFEIFELGGRNAFLFFDFSDCAARPAFFFHNFSQILVELADEVFLTKTGTCSDESCLGKIPIKVSLPCLSSSGFRPP